MQTEENRENERVDGYLQKEASLLSSLLFSSLLFSSLLFFSHLRWVRWRR